MEQKNGDGSILTSAATKVKIPFTMGNVSLGYELDDMSSVNATFSLTSFNMKNDGHTTTSQTGGLYGNGFNYVNDMKMRNKKTSFSGNVDYQRFFNKERTKSFVLTYQLDYSPSKMEQNNRFSNTEIDILDANKRVVAKAWKDLGKESAYSAVMNISNPQLWDIHSPYLYTIQTRLLQNVRQDFPL